jgi:Heterokaryon incompatibility protein (HET)
MDQKPDFRIIYDQLNTNLNEFRLLKLIKRNGDLPSCELFHSSLNWKTEYEALSYPWGGAKSQGKIRLNGKVHLVTQNLANALADVQSDDSSRILWVDALCIDQSNLQERNHQVKQMGRIYQNAKRVLVWLGRPDNPEEAQGSDGLSTLKFLNDILLTDLAEVNANAMHRLRISIETPSDWRKWHELAVLCELPYWSRLWIVQEIGLASFLEVFHGQSSIDWGIFASIREILAQIVQRDLCPRSFLPVAKIILESMPARLEEQRAHQHPVWLQKLHDDLRLITKIGNYAL